MEINYIILRCVRLTNKRMDNGGLPVKDSGFFQDVSQIDVGIEEIWIECNGFLEMMNGKPYFTLGIEHTTEVAPGNSKVRPCLNGLQVACLEKTSV